MTVTDEFWDIWLSYLTQTREIRAKMFLNTTLAADLCAVMTVAPVVESRGYFEIFDGPKPPKSFWRWLIAVRSGLPLNPRLGCHLANPPQREALFGPEIEDIVACSQDLKQVTSRMVGHASVVGWPSRPYQVQAPIRVRESPLSWLLARGSGVFLCGREADVGDWLRECERGVVVSSLPMGEAMEKKMKRAGIARPRILVDA